MDCLEYAYLLGMWSKPGLQRWPAHAALVVSNPLPRSSSPGLLTIVDSHSARQEMATGLISAPEEKGTTPLSVSSGCWD